MSVDVAYPLVWSPNGAFLTVGYATEFPVVDDIDPPATMPTAMTSLTVFAGPPNNLPNLEEMMAEQMRHQ